jgi:hypothetical protein
MTLFDIEQLPKMRKEIEDLERRLMKRLGKTGGYVADSVRDYRTGKGKVITIRGYAVADYSRTDALSKVLAKQTKKLDAKILAVEKFVATITDSTIRSLIRLHYVEGKTWAAAASRVYGEPNEDRARMALKRFFEKFK